MKTKILLLLLQILFTSFICYAQFPAPRSLATNLEYIELGDWGYCCGNVVVGPVYCTDFNWDAPGSDTEATLKGYNVYGYFGDYKDGMEIPFHEISIIAQTTDTYLQMEFGSGVVWVTAVYSDPEGESEPSNIVVSGDLPLDIKEVKIHNIFFTYNKQKNGIEIKGIENIASFRIFRLDGIEIPISDTSDFINTNSMEKGVYIIKIVTKYGGEISDKIIIK